VEVRIGNRYIEEFCSLCKSQTIHRVYKRFGKAQQGKGKGKFSLKRQVIYCLICQKRRIEKPRK